MVNTNPTPKSRFTGATAWVKEHRELMQSDALQRGIDYALLDYQRLLAENTADANAAAGSHFKIKGALEFIAVLKNLAESPATPASRVITQLDHAA